jgi:hypothetical protein
MATSEANAEFAPAIEFRQTAAEQAGQEDEWSMEFLLQNHGADVLQVESARLPHGQFRSEAQRFDPPLLLAPGEKILFSPRVRCHEPPGLVTVNAFVILSVFWMQERWRIFVRIRVVIGTDGTPQTATESITTQKIGFSGIDH